MATNIFNYDGSLLTTVADGALDQTHASIKFPGRGYQNYGQPVLENLLWIMQNFAGTTAPSYPKTGQLWYDTSTGNSVLKVYTGAEWITAGGVVAADTAPAAGANQGAFWYDTTNKQLNTWNGSRWDLVGPLGSKINDDPSDPALPPNSAIEAMSVMGTDGNEHQLWRISVGGVPLAILSKDQAFEPQSSILATNGFSTILPGLNLNSTINNIGLGGDKTVFKSNQNNAPDRDGFWDLGTASNRFRNFYTSSANISGSVGIGATPNSQFKLQVNGNSYLNGGLLLGAATATTVPLKLAPSSTLPTPAQNGAVEFDGNNFYFTRLINGVPTRQQPLFTAASVNTKTLYVSSLGNDTNDGRSRTSPYKTIKRALKYLVDNNLSGYSIFVESGEYLEQNPLYVPPYTSIVGDNLRRVIVRPVHNTLDLFHVDVNTYFFGMTFKDHRAPAFCFAFPCSLATASVNSSGTVTSVIPTYSQTGYGGDFEVYIEAPAYNQSNPALARQATAMARVVNGAIVDIEVTDGGTGYTTNPDVLITGATGSGASAKSRIKDGKLVAIDMLSFGSGYTAPINISISGGGGAGAAATATIGNGVIGSIEMTDFGAGYDPDRAPWVSIKPKTPVFITSSPYVQNCSSITGPFDVYDPVTNTGGNLVTVVPPYDLNNPGSSFGAVDPNGAGAGIRVDGEVCANNTVIRSFVADSFTQLNQGGIGHLIINRGYAQFVSCFTTFSSIGYWARGGGFANISNSVIDFGNIGLQAEGYYPGTGGNGYTTGTIAQDYYSTVGSIDIVAGGSGYAADFAVSFGTAAGMDPSGSPATGIARVENGAVVRVDLTFEGSGFVTQIDTAIALSGGTGTGAYYKVILTQVTGMEVRNTSYKPQVGSAMLYNNRFYTVLSAIPGSGGPGSWGITFTPSLVTADSGDTVKFHEISNFSTGGLALEYVGAGITYNSLPVYGGNPDTRKQVRDRNSDTDISDLRKKLAPGVVYYVTIDNTGDFKIGPYFGVNFVDGTITLNPSSGLNLTNIKRIGQFSRNGAPVGWYADEISKDPTLTHTSQPIYDDSTLPTQSAVRGYFEQINSNVVPKTDSVSNVGSSTKRWNTVHAINGNLVALSTNTASVTTLTAASGSISTLTSTTATVTTLSATSATIATTLSTSTINAGTASVSGSLVVTGNASVGGNVVITGNLAVLGTTTTIDSTVTTIEDPTLELGTGPNGSALVTNDGLDRGLLLNYYSSSNRYDFLGLDNSAGRLVYIRNVNKDSNPYSGTYGDLQIGNIIAQGTITATGNIYTSGNVIAEQDVIGFFLSPSDQQLKTNIEPITSALSTICSINGVSFDWNATAREIRPNRTRREIGVIAQDVEKAVPEVVSNGIDGYKMVAYDKLVPVLIEAIKELNAKVTELESRLRD